jgi:hypothetical protein
VEGSILMLETVVNPNIAKQQALVLSLNQVGIGLLVLILSPLVAVKIRGVFTQHQYTQIS